MKERKIDERREREREREKQTFSIAVIFPFFGKAHVILVLKGISRALCGGRPKPKTLQNCQSCFSKNHLNRFENKPYRVRHQQSRLSEAISDKTIYHHNKKC